MDKSICTSGFIPLRKEPSEQSEMVSQLLFGDTFDIIETNRQWSRIKMHYDGYKGWINSKQISKQPDTELENLMNASTWIVPAPFVKIVSKSDKSAHFISGGSTVYFNTSERNSFTIGNKAYFISSDYDCNKPAGTIVDNANAFLNSPYLWGGRSFYGIDCSGFIQVIHKICGFQLPRDASQQVESGAIVGSGEEAVSGDLAFFDNEEGKITHVGLCLGQGDIIHASGCVRVDKLDRQGIFNEETGVYSHKLRVIKRLP